MRFLDEIIEAPAGDGIAASVDRQRGLDEVGGGHAPDLISLNREGAILRFGFVAKDCDHMCGSTVKVKGTRLFSIFGVNPVARGGRAKRVGARGLLIRPGACGADLFA